MASLNDFIDSDDEYNEQEVSNLEKGEKVDRDKLLKAVGISKIDKAKQEEKITQKALKKQLKKQQEDEMIQKFGKKSVKKLSQPSDFYRESNVGIPQASLEGAGEGEEDDDNTVSFRDLATTLLSTSATLKKKLKENDATGRLLSKPEDPVALARKNRIAGYQATNKKLTETWSGTINSNLAAEHLHFPLNKESAVTSTESFAAKTPKRQQSELEADIQKVLLESGASKDAVARYEAQLRAEAEAGRREKRRSAKEGEEEERRMGLQMYYQQLKARRRAKIKSKSFRKLERQRKAELKEMEIAEMIENDPEAALDIEMKADRDRILERATLRHKSDSKWAKKAKVKGLSKVPEIKKVLAEKARIGNELTRKMSSVSNGLTSDRGNDTYDLDGDDEEAMMNNEDVNVFANSDDDDENNARERDDYETGAAMDAEREEREMDDEERVEEILQESAGQKVSAPMFAGKSVVLSSTAGGRKVNVSGNVTIANTNLFKEVGFADIKDDIDLDGNGASVTTSELPSTSAAAAAAGKPSENDEDKEANPWLHVPAGSAASIHKKSKQNKKDKEVESGADGDSSEEGGNKLAANGESDSDDEDENDRKGLDLIAASEDQKRLVREAFADDESDVELELQREKDAEIEELAGVKDSKADVLPGWGSWAGEGVVESQRAKERRLRREKEEDERRKAILEKVRVIRKDRDLKHVVINEKVDKKAAIYKAKMAPIGTTQEHYERMLSVPVGKEWQTSIAHRRMIVPKITVEKGKVIKPLAAPKKLNDIVHKKNTNSSKKFSKH